MISMSGFGSGSANGSGRRYQVECASINRKGLEILVTLPRGLSSLEPHVREEVQKKINRGRIHIVVTDEIFIPSKKKNSLINQEIATYAFQELQKTQQRLHLSGPITLEMILRVPGVLCQETAASVDPLVAWPFLKKALHAALENLCVMKDKEGKNLLLDLKKHFQFLEQTCKKIQRRVPQLLKNRRTQIQSRLAALNIPIATDDPSLLRELALFADRSDISEEITRLQSHLTQSQSLLHNNKAAARPLDYLAQEMFREFNTLSNKANDATISHLAVQSKSKIDKIREQLANLE